MTGGRAFLKIAWLCTHKKGRVTLLRCGDHTRFYQYPSRPIHRAQKSILEPTRDLFSSLVNLRCDRREYIYCERYVDVVAAHRVDTMSTGNSTHILPETPSSWAYGLDDGIIFLLTIIVPWAIGLGLIIAMRSRPASTFVIWTCVAVTVLGVYIGGRQRSMGALVDALEDSVSRATQSIEFVLTVATPLLVLPLGVFFARAALARGTGTQPSRTGGGHRLQTRNQASLITFTLKVMIGVYIAFGVIDRCGISLNGVVDLATIMSIGVSWSMRDWLSSAWAGLILASCTDLCADRVFVVGTTGTTPIFRVRRMGTLFVTCEKISKDNELPGEVFVPNSVLTQSGFCVLDT